MHILNRTIVGAGLAVALIAPVSATADATPAPAAKTAAKHFKVVLTYQGAKLGACKVSVSKGAAWRIYGRIDTHQVRGPDRYNGGLGTLYKNNYAKPYAIWRPTPVTKGKYSKIGSVRVPRKPGYSIEGGVGVGQTGNGGPINIARLPKC